MANRRASLIVAAAALGLVVVGLTAAGVAPPTTVRIPMTEPGPEGKHLTIEATLYRPAGDGRHPILLFNHGSTGRGAVDATTTMRPSILAPFFVTRGFAVLAPMRRGRGASQGVHAEQEGACQAALLDPGFARALEDVDAAVAYVRIQPWADPDRLLVGGQSRGGILSVAYASKRPELIQAVINFAGGWTSDGCDRYGPSFNEAKFAAAGHLARMPMLWLYADNDRYYLAESIRRYHQSFTQAGGAATFHLFPAFGADGHRLVDRVEVWGAAVDDFLRQLNLVSR